MIGEQHGAQGQHQVGAIMNSGQRRHVPLFRQFPEKEKYSESDSGQHHGPGAQGDNPPDGEFVRLECGHDAVKGQAGKKNVHCGGGEPPDMLGSQDFFPEQNAGCQHDEKDLQHGQEGGQRCLNKSVEHDSILYDTRNRAPHSSSRCKGSPVFFCFGKVEKQFQK